MEREAREKVVDHLIDTDDSEMHFMSMLRGADLQGALDDDAGVPAATRTCWRPVRARRRRGTGTTDAEWHRVGGTGDAVLALEQVSPSKFCVMVCAWWALRPAATGRRPAGRCETRGRISIEGA